MRYPCAQLAVTGKALDLITTGIGLSLGYVEMNPVALTPFGIAAPLLLFPIILAITEAVAEHHPARRFLLLPGAIAWILVLWNLGVMLT